MTSDQVLELLRARIAAEGMAPSPFAEKHGISIGYFNGVLSGRYKPGPKILALLGLRLVRSFEPKR